MGWFGLEKQNNADLKTSFEKPLLERLQHQAREDRMRFDQYVKSFHRAVFLYSNWQQFRDHVLAGQETWQEKPRESPRLHKRPPSWMPPPSIVRMFPHNNFIFLMDSNNIVREVYSRNKKPPPAFLLKLPNLLLMMSRGQILLYWVTYNIKKLTREIIDFERQELGFDHPESETGDELMVLHHRFHHLAAEVQASREIIREDARKKTRVIVHNAMDAIIAINQAGTITTWNPSAEKIFGWTADQVAEKKLAEVIVPDGGEGRFTALLCSIAGKEEKRGPHEERWEREVIHRDGHIFTSEMSAPLAGSEDEHLVIIFIHDITDRKKTEEEREKLINELQEALTEIKTLQGIIPICASCKNIRDDKGYWGQIESYIGAHSDAEFTHGICPDCAKKLYPDLLDDSEE